MLYDYDIFIISILTRIKCEVSQLKLFNSVQVFQRYIFENLWIFLGLLAICLTFLTTWKQMFSVGRDFSDFASLLEKGIFLLETGTFR